MNHQEINTLSEKIITEVSKQIVGKNDRIELILCTFLSGGHVLLEDLPGLGKTMLIRSLSKALGLPFGRIQFTPDLLPSDLSGINFYSQKEEDFVFKAGPLFSTLVLADELNRATPRTQSALLEAMQEKQITVDGVSRDLGQDFMVLATQNPVETFGTFPLPEAQLDRFMIRMSMGYPSFEDELKIVRDYESKPLDTINQVVDSSELTAMKESLKEIKVSDEIIEYILKIVTKTREDEKILIGASPRASIALYELSKTYAAMQGRDYIIPEDVRYLAPFVLNHRIMTRNKTSLAGSLEFVDELVKTIQAPMETI